MQWGRTSTIILLSALLATPLWAQTRAERLPGLRASATPPGEPQPARQPETERDNTPAQVATIGAVIQNVYPGSRLLQFRTNNHEIIELQVPTRMLDPLAAGDRIEVVIHKPGQAVPSATEQQPLR